MIKHVTLYSILGWDDTEVNYLDVLLTWAIDKLGLDVSDIDNYMFDNHYDRTDVHEWMKASMYKIQMAFVEQATKQKTDWVNAFIEREELLEWEQEALTAYVTYYLHMLGHNQRHTNMGQNSYFNNILDECMGTTANDTMTHLMYQAMMIIRNEY